MIRTIGWNTLKMLLAGIAFFSAIYIGERLFPNVWMWPY